MSNSNLITNKLPEIQKLIEKTTGCLLKHVDPINYSLTHSLRFWIDNHGKCTAEHKGDVEVRVYFSFHMPLYVIYCLDVKQKFVPYGHLLQSRLLTPEVLRVVENIRNAVNGFGLEEMDEQQFDQPMVGKVTELDGTPVTKFQFYFTELI